MYPKKEGLFLAESKRGMSHDIFFNVFELIVALIVAVALLSFVTDVAEGTIFEKNYIARDLSLLVDTIYTAPGDVEYTYVENTNRFIVDFSESKIKVLNNEKENTPETFYLFGENKKIPVSYTKISFLPLNHNIKFTKSSNLLGIKASIKNENK